jgi:uncharacterized protein (DUF1684 family)
LTPEQQRSFAGLSYYDENPALKFVVKPEEYDAKEPVNMVTSTGAVASYVRWGRIGFKVGGEPTGLTLYRDAEDREFFLPFADATSGAETYPAGRYLETQPMADGRVLVDFNYAYSPYCAYNDQWSCPLTPFENRLPVSISAGEKTFK